MTEILEELRVKFGESGPVRKVIVPRPPFGVKASEIFGKVGRGGGTLSALSSLSISQG